MFFKLCKGNLPSAVGQCRPRCHKKVGVGRKNYLLGLKVKGNYKALSKLRKIVERAAQKGNLSSYGLTAGKSAYSLIYHRLKNGSGNVAFLCSVIQKRLNVRLCENAAAGGYGIDSFRLLGKLVKPRNIGI